MSFIIRLLYITLTSFPMAAHASATLDAANKASASLMMSTNAGLNNYLLIFSLAAFLIGITSFLPGIRRPGWGAGCIGLSIVILSAPSCINSVT